MNRIELTKPWMGADEALALSEVIESGWIAQGPRVARFEATFASSVAAPCAVATSNWSAALHLALIVAGVGEGDEVVVPSVSFISSADAATFAGATPVFADVDARTGNVTADLVEAAISVRTKAVIVADQCGVPVDLRPIRALCDARGIVVIEDAGCATGSTYRGRPVGADALLTIWSFHPDQLLTTGEGGMITTARQDLADRARQLRDDDRRTIGLSCRMTDLQAAVGLIQLARLPEVVRRRRELAARYNDLLSDIAGIRTVVDAAWGESNFQTYWVEVDPSFATDRDGLFEALAAAGVSASRGFMAADREPEHPGTKVGDSALPVAERLVLNTLGLPLYHQMTYEQQDRVVDAVRAAAGQERPLAASPITA